MSGALSAPGPGAPAAAARLNVEVKARCADPERVRRVLEEAGATFRGTDLQRDVYFTVPEGRLKLRRGTIERSLVFYRRSDRADVRRSDVMLVDLATAAPGALAALEETLARALGVHAVVEKRREIRFVGNVKFHLDDVPGRGRFVEIEAIDDGGMRGEDALRAECEAWRERLGIAVTDLVGFSYSDPPAAAGEPASSTPGRFP